MRNVHHTLPGVCDASRYVHSLEDVISKRIKCVADVAAATMSLTVMDDEPGPIMLAGSSPPSGRSPPPDDSNRDWMFLAAVAASCAAIAFGLYYNRRG